MKKNLLIFLAFVLIINIKLFAQQEPQFSQNMFNQMAINPGYAGLKNMVCGKLFYRTQWVGFKGQPKETEVTVDMPFPVLHGGLGISIYQDGIGFYKDLVANLSYSYHIDFGNGSKLGLGVRAGIFNRGISGTWIAPDQTDGSSDVAVPNGSATSTVFAAAFGATYMTPDLHVGLATSNLNQPVTELKNSKLSELKRHYYLTSGYNFYLSPTLLLKPSVYVKTDGVVAQLDVNCMLETKISNRTVWGGLTYRPGDALAPMFGVEIIPNLNLGYSYDITLSKIGNYSSGSHEIFLGYCLKLERIVVPSKYRNPMFL